MKWFYNTRYLFLFFCVVSGIILVATFFIEYGFKVPPCNLCLLERIPYGLVSLLGIIGLIYPSRIFLLGILVVFGGSVLLSAYHLAVVYHWMDVPTLCTKPWFMSVEDLLAKDTIAPCDSSPFNVLGLPLALWNLLVSGGLGGVCGYGIFRK
jgi:disulfide bond formation protein DsbB